MILEPPNILGLIHRGVLHPLHQIRDIELYDIVHAISGVSYL